MRLRAVGLLTEKFFSRTVASDAEIAKLRSLAFSKSSLDESPKSFTSPN